VNPEAIDALLLAWDRITAMVDDVEHSEEADISPALERLRPLVDAHATAAVSRVTPAIEPPGGEGGGGGGMTGIAAEPEEFMLSPRVLAAALEPGTALYGIKFDWHACEAELGLSPPAVAQRIEGVGVVLDCQLDLHGPPLKDGLPAAPYWYRAIISSSLKPEEFTRRLALPIAGIARLERVAGQPEPPVAPPPAPAGPVTASASHVPPASLRVSVSLIDRMMELASELALVRNQALRTSTLSDPSTRKLMRRLDSVSSDLHNAALQMRMQPVSTLFDRFPRMVRDLARQLGKQVEIKISGAEVELDKTVLEKLSDPLTHLIRNCCDHGIETPERRARNSKPAQGVIRLSARQDRGQIVIEVADDGKGVDVEAVRNKALESGLKTRQELDRLAPRQVCELIMASGFSTAAVVTDVSGRGVGMDVVKTNLEQIGGVVEIDSTAGQGTVFSLRLPLTLAIMPCLLLRSSSQRYAVAQRDVEEILRLGGGNSKVRLECSHDEEVLRLRDILLPAVRLDEALREPERFDARTWARIIRRHHGEEAAPASGYAAVMRAGSRRFALVFDEVLGNEDVVVKPLNPLLRPLGIYAGATILGDGGVSLILSAEGISRHCGVFQRAAAEEQPSLRAAAEEQDSLGVLLTRQGGDALLAVPLGAVRRVIMVAREKIERVAGRELAHVDGATLNVIRFEEFLQLPACPDAPWHFLVVPRRAGTPVGFLVSEIVDTESIPLPLDRQAYAVAGVTGSAVLRGHIALVLDLEQFATMWEQGRGAAQRALPAAASDAGRRRILVVEDTQFFQTLVGNSLREEGFEVVTAPHGKQGLAELERGRFDAVVSDIEMPEMDGWTFAAQMRARPEWRQIPLIALTTLSGAEQRRRAAELGFDAYEIKFDRASFLAAVRRSLEKVSVLAPRGEEPHA
jgi:two-component system chemotaxis sensor kinase CheA